MKNIFIYIAFYSAFTLSLLGQSLKTEAEEQILNHFKQYVTLSFEKLEIPDTVKEEIADKYNQKFFRNEVYHWKIFQSDSLIAHAFLDNVLGRTQPITFLVVLDPDGRILYNSIIKYRSHRGAAVTNRSWLDQFIGKSIESGFKVGNDIQAISGATYSVKSLTKGFNKILALYLKLVP